MKKTVFLAVFVSLFLFSLQLSAEEIDPFAFDEITGDKDAAGVWKPVTFGIYTGMSMGGIAGGKQLDLIKSSYSLSEKSSMAFNLDAGFFIFPTRWIGIEGNYAFIGDTIVDGFVMVGDDEVHKSYSTFDFWALSGGIVFRIPFYINSILDLSVCFSGGVTWTSLQFDGTFKQYVIDEGGTLPFADATARGYGGYGAVGADLFVGRYFFVGSGMRYSYQNVKFKGASGKMDGHLVSAYIRIGAAF